MRADALSRQRDALNMPLHNRPTTVYLHDTVPAVHLTLERLGARMLSRYQEGSNWRLLCDGVRIEIYLVECLLSWEADFSIDRLHLWTAPLDGVGWEPQCAALLRVEEAAADLHVLDAVVEVMLGAHTGIVDSASRWYGPA